MPRYRLNRAAVVAVTVATLAVSAAAPPTALSPVAAAADTANADARAVKLLRDAGEGLAELKAATSYLECGAFPQAGKAVAKFYYSYYDPSLERASNALHPRPGSGVLRKPEMESFKRDASFAIADHEKNKALRAVSELREGVARDVMILVGGVSDDAAEDIKVAVADAFLASLKDSGNAGSAARRAAERAAQLTGTSVATRFPSIPITARTIDSKACARPHASGDEDSSSSWALPVAVVIVAAIIAAIAAAGGTLPAAPTPG